MLIWIVVSAFLIGFDQFTKFLVTENISEYDTLKIINGIIDFVNVKNTGAAFSILNNATWFLALISAVFCIGIVVYLLITKPKNKLYCTGLCMMFAGAFGNGIDRIFRGYVIDFIKTVFIDFPIFNIADILIVLGAFLCVLYVMFFSGKEEIENGTDNAEA